MPQLRTSRKFDVIFILVLVLLLGLTYFYRVAASDWIFFARYHPSAEVSQVATDTGLSSQGRHLFYRGNPQFSDLSTINDVCDVERLGCLTSHGQIYILDSPNQHDQTVVTAAHEMLHLAYERLSPAQKADLAPLLDEASTANASGGIQSELSGITNENDRRDEAHSLLGTEYTAMPPALSQYYDQYFSNRTLVVAAANRSLH